MAPSPHPPDATIGVLLNESALPGPLRARIDRARASLLQGRAVRVGSAVQLECGSLWFTDGIDLSLTVRDELRVASPALAFFGAIAIGAYAAYTFSEALETRWVWAAITVLFVACGIASAFVNISRRDRATARMELGTLLLDDFFAYLSHGRAVAIPRSAVIRSVGSDSGCGVGGAPAEAWLVVEGTEES